MRTLLLLIVLGLTSSCGLQDGIPSLPDPAVDYVGQNSLWLSFVFQSPNSSVNFQGYEIFYKIYTTTTGNFSRLLADRDTIWASPTISYLQANGYSQFSMSSSRFDPINSPSSYPSQSPAVISGMKNGDTVKVDFSSFLSQNSGQQPYSNGSIINEPLITFTNSSGLLYQSTGYLYRASPKIAPQYCSFWNLPSAANNLDLFDSMTSQTGGPYEMNIFIVAYGVTDTLQLITSRPVPWGIIGPIYYTSSTAHN